MCVCARVCVFASVCVWEGKRILAKGASTVWCLCIFLLFIFSSVREKLWKLWKPLYFQEKLCVPHHERVKIKEASEGILCSTRTLPTPPLAGAKTIKLLTLQTWSTCWDSVLLRRRNDLQTWSTHWNSSPALSKNTIRRVKCQQLNNRLLWLWLGMHTGPFSCTE